MDAIDIFKISVGMTVLLIGLISMVIIWGYVIFWIIKIAFYFILFVFAGAIHIYNMIRGIPYVDHFYNWPSDNYRLSQDWYKRK